MDGNGKWWLAYCLGATDKKTAATAIDLLLAVISEARLSPEQLAECMAKFVAIKECDVKYSVYVNGFREVSRASALHSYFCFTAACAFLHAAYSSMSASAKISWLEFLIDVQGEFGFTVSAQMKGTLENEKSSGKTGQLAIKLAKYANGANAQTRLAVMQARLLSKVDRVERWQRWTEAYNLQLKQS
jgi:hypothetical protein